MARTMINIPFQDNFDRVENKTKQILINNGFKEINRNNEIVWKKGTGFLTAMQFIKIEYNVNMVIVSAWVQMGIGNVGAGEMELSGVVAAIPKKQLMKTIQKLQQEIR